MNFNSDKINIFLYCIILICGILKCSTISWGEKLGKLMVLIIVLLFIFSLIFNKHTLKQWFILLIGIFIGGITYLIYSINTDLLYIILIAFSVDTVKSFV